MAEGTKLEIVSPERLVLSEQVRSVTVPGTEGYFTVLGDHAPLMTTLKPGFVTAIGEGGETHSFYVRGGFADIAAGGLTILAEDARAAADFDRAEIEALIAERQQEFDAAAPEAKAALQNELDTWRNLLIDAAATTTLH